MTWLSCSARTYGKVVVMESPTALQGLSFLETPDLKLRLIWLSRVSTWVSHSQLSWTPPFVFLFQICPVSPMPALWVLEPASQAFGEGQKLGVRKNLEGLW